MVRLPITFAGAGRLRHSCQKKELKAKGVNKFIEYDAMPKSGSSRAL
jgi:hypothetical protein